MHACASNNLRFRFCALMLACFLSVGRAEATYSSRWSLPVQAAVNSVAFSPQEDSLAAGTDSIDLDPIGRHKKGVVYLWSSRTGRLLHTFITKSDVKAVAWTPDGRFLLGLGGIYESIGELNVWNVKTNQLQAHFENLQSETFYSLAVSPDGQLAACGTFDRLFLVNISNGKIVRQIMGREGESFSSLAFSPHGKYLLGVSDSGNIRIWETATGALSQPETEKSLVGFQAMYLRDGRICIAEDGQLRIMGQSLFNVSRTIKSNAIPIDVFAVEKTGILIATGAGNSTYLRKDGSQDSSDPIQIWNLQTGKLVEKLEGHAKRVRALAFSPHSMLASGSADHTVRVWEMN